MTIWQYPRWLVVLVAWAFALLARGATGCLTTQARDERNAVRTESQ